jgi:hypothetical protein
MPVSFSKEQSEESKVLEAKIASSLSHLIGYAFPSQSYTVAVVDYGDVAAKYNHPKNLLRSCGKTVAYINGWTRYDFDILLRFNGQVFYLEVKTYTWSHISMVGHPEVCIGDTKCYDGRAVKPDFVIGVPSYRDDAQSYDVKITDLLYYDLATVPKEEWKVKPAKKEGRTAHDRYWIPNRFDPEVEYFLQFLEQFSFEPMQSLTGYIQGHSHIEVNSSVAYEIQAELIARGDRKAPRPPQRLSRINVPNIEWTDEMQRDIELLTAEETGIYHKQLNLLYV